MEADARKVLSSISTGVLVYWVILVELVADHLEDWSMRGRTSWESSENQYIFGVLVGDSNRKSNVNLIISEGGDSETVDNFFPTEVDPSKLDLFSPFKVYT